MSTNASVAGNLASISSTYGHPYIYTLASLLAVGFLSVWYFSTGPLDPKEPYALPPRLPIIGHVLGLLQHEAEYFQMLLTRTTRPIFTLKLLSAKLYVVTSPELVQSVFKNSRTLSLEKITLPANKRILGLTDEQMKTFAHKEPGRTEEFPLAKDTHVAMQNALAPGAQILQMNVRAVNRFADHLNAIGMEGQEENLCLWLRNAFTRATAAGLYGASNPIETDPSLIQAICDFEDGVGLLSLDIMPYLIARKANKARNAFASAFKTYYLQGDDKDASALVQDRRECLVNGGMKAGDLAMLDVGILMAATLNSNPGMFWLICYIFSDASLLAEIREQIMRIVNISENKEASVDIPSLQVHCPLLVSAWQETLRLVNATAISRAVLEDTMLNDTYLLKKGAFVQMACGPMHTSSSTWGDDSHLYNPYRFLDASVEGLARDKRKTQKQGYAPFGGGVNLCPGRHFVSMEILGIAAMIVAGYDIEMKGGGVLKMPGTLKQGMAVQVKRPDADVNVVVKRRQEFEGCKWVYGGSEGSEDVDQFMRFD